ncbi:hypothetical protein FIBSPDRAFT_1039494 [Athelia psychrophila]|uniref:BTB domain-containing protein n=1 Tax=Athelia psychrophila TaxID=1759441 RepID=A0A166RXE4_9AGAM|nr:hypothetical protein FIBSPDRAFT_1039494 [Fibularhizoctonia sp. CBS 109695]
MSSILTSAPPSPSLASLGISRAASTLDSNELDLPAAQGNNDLEAKATRHSQYYFKDGNTVFLIEDVLYNVHRYFFERDSTHFRSILENAQAADEQNPIVLPGVSCADFDEFLAILYPTDFRRPTEKTTAQWTSVLHLAAKWGFESIQLLAIDNLTTTAIAIDKIVLGRRYGISDWLPGAYEAVCTRADPLTVEEGMKLGVEDSIRISAARQVYGCAKARYEIKHLPGDLGDIFKLEKPCEELSVGFADVEEGAIKILEDQVMTVQAELAAFPAPTPTTQTCQWYYNQPSRVTCASQGHLPSQSCARCQVPNISESDERRLKREDKEDKERRLKDLKEQRDVKQRDLVERQGRMALFR